MTTADLGEIRVAVARALKSVKGLTPHPRYPGVINSPAAVVVRRETVYDPAFDVGADHTLAIRIFVSFSNLPGAQDRMDDYCAADGPLSIRAAIDADPTLGGVVDACRIATADEEKIAPYSGIDYLTVDLVLEVL